MTPFAAIAAALTALGLLAPRDATAPTAADLRFAEPASTRAAQVLRVGPSRSIQTVAAAARLATDGATIEVDAGSYRGDVAVWRQNDLTLRAVGGRVRLLADGAAAEGKAIWVVRGARVSIEGFDFEGARAPGRNGAGIRFERGSLRVRDCRFIDDQSGILTGNDPEATLEVTDSEFVSLHPEDGQNHHLYAGTIGRLSVTGSYFHRGAIGHLLKSRAALNLIRYNRLTDEDGRASYELEFPNGGLAIIVANIIQQSAASENPAIIAYGLEGLRWPVNEIHLVHNTVVDDQPRGGVFVRVPAGAGQVHAVNNLWVGDGSGPLLDEAGGRNNFLIDRTSLDPSPAAPYRLKPSSPLWGRAIAPGVAHGQELAPTREFRLPRGSVPLPAAAATPGALQSPAAGIATPAR